MIRNGTKAWTLATAGAMALFAGQASAQDVVMRRPLPHKPGVTGTQNSCDPLDPLCTPTQTPTPSSTPTGSPTPTVTPTPTPTPTYDDPPPGNYIYTWQVGDWSGGGTCGQQSTMTRSVTCQATSVNGGLGGTPAASLGTMPGQPEIMSASYSDDAASRMSPAIFDPEHSDVHLALAQFGGPGPLPGPKIYNVDPQLCVQNAGPRPASSYSGTGANCQYEIIGTQTSTNDGGTGGGDALVWRINPGDPGTATCSDYAYAQPNYACRRVSDGATVDKSYCNGTTTPGSSVIGTIPGYIHGNHSGCVARWRTTDNELGCHPEGDPYGTQNGPVHYVDRQVHCVQDDGTVLTGVDEAKCPIDPDRGFSGVVVAGQCSKSFTTTAGLACYGHPQGQSSSAAAMASVRTVIFPGAMKDGGAKACVNSGSTCCQERRNYTKGRVETVGSSAAPQAASGTYYDDGTLETGWGTTSYQGDNVYHDMAIGPMIITGPVNSTSNCPYPAGTRVNACHVPFGCRSEVGDNMALEACDPSTAYYRYPTQTQDLVSSNGASAPTYVVEAPK